MLKKEVVIDKIEILEDGQMQIRQATKILEDGVEIGKTYHRWGLAPGQGLHGQTTRVANIANIVWTPDVIAAYKDKLANPII